MFAWGVAAGAAGQALGPASAFNVWTFGDAFLQGADAQGAVAVGGNANLADFGVAIPNSFAPPRAGLLVGGSLTFSNGSVDSGNAYVAGSATTALFNVNNGGGLQANLGAAGLPIGFAAANAQLRTNSQAWAQAFANGSVANDFGTLAFTGTDAGLNVFDLDASQLAGIHTLAFTVPTGATAFVNVAGTDVAFSNLGTILNNLPRNRLLFNLPDARTLLVEGISFQGSLLAPDALLTARNGNIEGNVIVDQIGTLAAPATGEYHFAPFGFAFDGLTPVPEPGSAALLAAAAGMALLAWRRRRA